ncbi:hypothetical protein SEUCBS140593_009367 [Sporothrix eucalyptigena]|uniref:Enoyl-CoA hydratase n=1 Tax=Sporothrix eucalyptigena TaxID=1812306 RepID=A0ABP0CXQ1_9PEZI
MANRTGKKPIVVACNGYAHASPKADFRLPEVMRGVSALAGALPLCMWLFGKRRTMDLVLTGRILTVEEAVSWGLAKEIVPLDRLVFRTLDYAEGIASMSPEIS